MAFLLLLGVPLPIVTGAGRNWLAKPSPVWNFGDLAPVDFETKEGKPMLRRDGSPLKVAVTADRERR